VLVEHHDIAIAALLKPRDEILPDQPGAAIEDDFRVGYL
jgi:hypothetical protein